MQEEEKGRKNDFIDKKLRWDLLPLNEIEDIVKVYTKGAEKYGDNNWKKLDNAYDRYKGAMLRHLVEYEKGNSIDKETGCLHLAQVAWNAIAMLYFSKKFSIKNEQATSSNSFLILDKLDERILNSINTCNSILDEIETKNKIKNG